MQFYKKLLVLVIVNKDVYIDALSYGYYRMYYLNYKPIINQLHKNHMQLLPVARARQIEDTFTFARLGIVSYNIPFKISEYLINETEYLPFVLFNYHVQMIELLIKHKNQNSAKLLRVCNFKFILICLF